jgi:hypothetical protein
LHNGHNNAMTNTVTVCGHFALVVGVTPGLLNHQLLGACGAQDAYDRVQLNKFDAAVLSELAYAVDVIELEPPAADESAIYAKFTEALRADPVKFPPISIQPGRNIPSDVVMEYHPFVYEPASGLWCRLDSHFSKQFVAESVASKLPVLRAPKMNHDFV